MLYEQSSDIIPEELHKKEDIEKDREKAFRNSEKNFLKNKKKFDVNKKEHQFKEGELVYVTNGNKLNRGKLEEIRSGPFTISKKVSNSMYKLKCNKKNKESVVNSRNLRPYILKKKKIKIYKKKKI